MNTKMNSEKIIIKNKNYNINNLIYNLLNYKDEFKKIINILFS